MAETTLKQRLQTEVKTCMKAGDKLRLAAIRLIMSAIKQIEVDERIEVDDQRLLSILDKMAKQRRESIAQFETAGRDDLIQQEQFELELIQEYLPEALSKAEIDQLIQAAIAQTGAASMRDMGKVMGILKPDLQGRADMSAVSAQIKSQLA